MNALRFGGAIFLSDGSLPWSSNRSNSVCVAFFMLITSVNQPLRSALPLSPLRIKGVGHDNLRFDVMGGDKRKLDQPRFSRLSQGDAGL